YRPRIRFALGGIALLLVSLPFVPAVAGIGGSSVRYSYEPRLTPEVTGQFLQTPRGPVKLFAWSDPQTTFPHDALRVHASDARTLLVRSAAVDAPSKYQLFDLDRGGSVPLRVVRRTPTSLALALPARVRTGRFAFVASHEGMFGGRDYAYLAIVPPGAATSAISVDDRRTAPAVIDALLPLAAALVALVFAGKLA